MNKQKAEAEVFIKGCVDRLGNGFHPDTPFLDYINDDGSSVFTDSEAMEMEEKLDLCFNIDGFDVYGFTYNLIVV